jgi:hypothetical protein
MKKNQTIMLVFSTAFACFLFVACNDATPAKVDAVKDTAAAASPAVTNPNFVIAPIEYAELSEKALNHISKFEFDAWADMLADNVVYSFPDGDVDTRTKLEGKAAVVGWWKTWKEKSGIESMTMSEFNHVPIDIIKQPKGGATLGVVVISYFSNKLVFKGKSVPLRFNYAVHFNADKKIDRYTTYYDRGPIIKAMGGKSYLDDTKTKK